MSDKKESLKSVRVELILDKKSPYKILRRMRKNHKDIKRAKIGLAWRKSLKPDKDGHLVLGMCHKASDLQRELASYDFIILLNKEVWRDQEFNDKKKCALMDHELCHAAPVINKSGHQKKDEKGRYCFRIRHHDIEEFRDIVKRHGVWKKDLELFAEELLKRRKKEKR